MTLRRARLEAIVLFVLALALGAHLWLSRLAPGTRDHEGREQNVLPTFDPNKVRRISIAEGAATGETVVLRRDTTSADLHDYHLEMRGSAPGDVDRAELASLLRTLDFAVFLRTSPAQQLPEAAFSSEAIRVVLDLEMESVSYHLVVGGEAPNVAGGRYAHLTGDDGTDRAGVVSDSLTSALTKDARDLRGHLLFPFAKSQTKRLSIERARVGDAAQWSTTLLADPLGFTVASPASEKETKGTTAPLTRRADPARVDGLFFQLARASFEAYPPAAAKSDVAPLILVQEPETGSAVRLEIGGDCPEHPELVQVVRTSPDHLVGCTKKVLLDVLAERDLALRGLWPLATDEIDHLVISGSAGTLDLIRDGAAFRRLAPDPGLIDLSRGNEFLEELSRLTLAEAPCLGEVLAKIRVVGQPEGSSGGRELHLTVLHDGAATSGTASFVGGALGRNTSVVRREDDGVCLALSDRARWLLDPSTAWYESLELLSVPSEEVLGVVTFGPGLPREEILRTEKGFELVGGAVDDALLSDLLEELAPLKAIRVAPQRTSSPWAVRSEVQIRARSSGPFTVRIGPRVRGGYLATSSGRRSEFVLAPQVVRILETSMQSRTRAQWDPTAFTELAVTARDVTYHFRKVGEDLVPTDDAPKELGPALVEALARLIPIAAVRGGSAMTSERDPELRLEGRYQAENGQTRRLVVSLGDQVLYGDQLAQRMTIDESGPQYYVDRTAVLAVLDLL